MRSRRAVLSLQGKKTDFSLFYEQNRSNFDKVAQLLNDDFSRFTLERVIEYRKTLNIHELDGVTVYRPYFLRGLFEIEEGDVFLDGGSYVGDTLIDFCEIVRKKGIKNYHAYAWEADPQNAKYIRSHLPREMQKNITILSYAMWSEKDTLLFSSVSDENSQISLDGTMKVEARTIDGTHGNDRITFIKMDIEGAELHALKGAEHLIKTQRPKLAISIYHEPQHLFEIPLLLHEWVPEYKLFCRHHSDNIADTVIYAKL